MQPVAIAAVRKVVAMIASSSSTNAFYNEKPFISDAAALSLIFPENILFIIRVLVGEDSEIRPEF